MINVTNKKCEFHNCIIRPIYCATHKSPDMKDIVNQKCLHPDCDLRPCYSNLFNPSLTHCRDHSVAKTSPISCMIGCVKQAIYVNVYPTRCESHRS